jgi:hypothetical protein
MLHCYSCSDLDPWVVHLIKTEIRALKLEYLVGD